MITVALFVLVLAATPADESPAPADDGPVTPALEPIEEAVLVLRSGQRLIVRSYDIDGRVVQIVGIDGEPLILRADLVDPERSSAATTAHVNERRAARAAERAAESAATAELEERQAKRAAARARSGQSAGGFNVAPETATRAPRAQFDAERPGVTPALVRRYDAKRRELNALVEQHNQIVDKVREMAMLTPARAITASQPLPEMRTRIGQLKKELVELEAQLRSETE